MSLILIGKYGIRSVTMDDVAREMGISKKTIYKYFKNKAALIEDCVMMVFEHIKLGLEKIHSSSQNAIDELFDIDKVVGQILKDHDPNIQYQLKKYYPQVASRLHENREKLIANLLMENIENGQRAGLYRMDFNNQIIAHLYCAKMETLPEEENNILQEFGTKKVMRQGLIYHIRGIATEKGLDYLENKLNTENPSK